MFVAGVVVLPQCLRDPQDVREQQSQGSNAEGAVRMECILLAELVRPSELTSSVKASDVSDPHKWFHEAREHISYIGIESCHTSSSKRRRNCCQDETRYCTTKPVHDVGRDAETQDQGLIGCSVNESIEWWFTLLAFVEDPTAERHHDDQLRSEPDIAVLLVNPDIQDLAVVTTNAGPDKEQQGPTLRPQHDCEDARVHGPVLVPCRIAGQAPLGLLEKDKFHEHVPEHQDGQHERNAGPKTRVEGFRKSFVELRLQGLLA
mmetsp:Transcript_11385/g.28727  ORF Transcript_11385/g.28727 Transcript_11385/m.28727 type:complete len:261 (-) Transcript_11385:105-887(-)